MADKFMTTLNGYEIRDAYAREKLEELVENGVPGGSGNAGNGVSDWNQNDATGEGYIKNRPFYMTREPSETISVVEILPETTVVLDETGIGGTVNPSGILFEIGKTYTVVWDGTTYDVECVMMEGIFSALCDPDLSFSNYPFAVVDYSPIQSGTIMVLSIEPSSEHTVSVSMLATVTDLGEMYFEPKYSSHLQSDWNNEDVTSVNYIKNKPFGAEIVNSILVDEKVFLFKETEENGQVVYLSQTDINGNMVGTNNFSSNAVFDVIFDGNKYENLSVALVPGSDQYYLGASIDSKTEAYDFSTCPFIIVFTKMGDLYMIFAATNQPGETHNISLFMTHEVVTKLPEKYQNQVNWNEIDETKGTYIVNKPFGDYYTGRTVEFTGTNGEAVEFKEVVDGAIYSASCYLNRPLVNGCKYKVTLGNNVYDNVICYEENEHLIIGSNEIDLLTNLGKYPFMIDGEAEKLYINNYDGSPLAFSIEEYETEIKVIDKKYIPIINPDWNENDDTKPTYIVNRPFYSKGVTILEEQTINISYIHNGYGLSDSDMYFEEGKTYTVIFDNTPYECICWRSNENCCVIGSGDVCGEGEGMGEDVPFGIYSYGHPVLMASSTGNHTVSVVKGTLDCVQIEEKYISSSPKWNGYSLEVVTELPETPDDKTFYVILES